MPRILRHARTAVMSAVISTRVGPHSISPSTRKSVFSTTVGVLARRLELRVQLDRDRGLLDRQVAEDLVAVAVDVLDAARLERDLGIALRPEQVVRAEVLVAHLVVGEHARRADDALRGLLLAALDGTLEVGEPAADRLHHRVRVDDVEPDARVHRVDRPRPGWDEG